MSTISEALVESLAARNVPDTDKAAVALARRYAATLDADPDSTAKVGPLLLSVLAELGLTPKGRAAVVGKGGDSGDGGGRDPLDELRERRDARQN